MNLRQLFHDLYKRLWVHRNSTMVGICLFAFVFMLYKGIITPEQFGLIAGTIGSVYVMLSKDDNKVETKDEFQIPDPKPKEPQ